MNHAIASFVGDKVVKVICQTCHSVHPYLEGKEKKKKTKATAFDQVAAKVDPSSDSKKAPNARKKKTKSGQRPLIRHKSKPPGKK